MYSRPFRPQSTPFPLQDPPRPTSPLARPPHPVSLLVTRPPSSVQERAPSALLPAPRPRDPSVGGAPLASAQADRDGNEARNEAHAEAKADDSGSSSSGPEAMLTLVLYTRHGRAPRVRRVIFVSAATRGAAPRVGGSGANGPASSVSALSRDFDDEKLFDSIRAEYGRMRGAFGGLLSARKVRDLGFLSYSRASQLAKQHKGARRKIFPVNVEDGFVETKLLGLYRKPRIGRGKYEWVEWISRLPENSGGQGSNEGKFALELVEGWWVAKIGLAVLAVVTLSLLATLLWIFLGVGGNHGDLQFLCHPRRCQDGFKDGFRGAGGRVETGAVLGVLVMMIGWTGIGAWVFSSWMA